MPTGIILLDKPQGLTSNGALQRVRKAYGAASAGHVGTLDPMATGMLPLCLDEATKVIAEIESGAKCYEFTVQLGARTDTGDAEGQVVEQQPVPPLDAARDRTRRWPGSAARLSRCRPCIRRSSAKAGRCTSWRARASKWSARRAPSKSGAWNWWQLAPTRSTWSASAPRAPTSACWARTSPARWERCGHLTRLRRTWVEPFRDMPMVTLEAVLAGAADASGLLQARRGAARTACRPGSRRSRSWHCGTDRPCAATSIEPEPGRRVRLYGPAGAFPGSGRAAARRLAAAAPPDGPEIHVSLGFAGPFL